jgi:phage terminase large subunit-like protein
VRAGPKAGVDGSRLPLRSPTTGAARWAAFCRKYIVVPKGHGVLRRLRPRPWQVELVGSVWDATPRPRLAGWMLPRGQGKTTATASLGLYDLLLGAEGATVVIVATDKEQARLGFGAAARMVELHPELERRVQVYADRLVVPARGASFRVLPAVAKRLEGLDYTLAILDEFGRMDREVYEVMVGASGKQPASTVVGIGTPPPDPAVSVLTTIRDYVADHPEDTSAVWREHSAAGFTDHPVECRHCWRLANPSLGDFLAEDGLIACLPPKMRPASFRRARLCQLVDELAGSWLPDGAWERCRIMEPRGSEIPDGAEVVLGFDGSFSGDCTALVAVTVEARPHVHLVRLWEAPEGSRDWRVPVVEVEDAIRDACRRWRVLEVAADPYRWQRSLELLDGEGIPVGEFPQSPARMGPATSRFYSAVVDGLLSHDGSAALARHVANAVLKQDSRGARLAKEHKDSKRRIDAAVAAVMAHDRAAVLAGEVGPAIYVLD